MISKFYNHKQAALELRKRGFTYGEIREQLSVEIPKSTLSTWFKSLHLSDKAKKRLDIVVGIRLKKAHQAALLKNKQKRKKYWEELEKKIAHMPAYLNGNDNIDIAKIILAVLYLGEGAKGKRKAFMLGNSDPKIISLYLGLLRKCYLIKEDKFRCTLQCRADQNIPVLEKFWSGVTKIPLSQFYKARIDPRTIGKKTKKPEYKGVCRIDYFSTDVYDEIKKIIEIVCDMGL